MIKLTREETKRLFNECLDGNKMKNCGREKCIDLIINLEELFPNVDFGNNKTGFLNVENVLKYKEKLGASYEV